MTKIYTGGLNLWSDEPATTDLLSFSAIAETVVDALFDDGLNPVALGVSGSWGSGKTTVLNLIGQYVEKRSSEMDGKVLIVRADPWRYDPALGPKESLISEVLAAMGAEFSNADPIGQAAEGALKKLIKRVNWAKAVKVAARTAISLQLPSLDDLTGLVSDEPETLVSEKGMAEFRTDFEAFLNHEALANVSQVVVLVDDLDRCLPETVVETLETIRLFLSVKGMSFVIAADEKRVAEAIQQKLQSPLADSEEESIASLYLHKIVQTTVPVPALSYFDTRSYLFLMLCATETSSDVYEDLVKKCAILRLSAGSLDDLELPNDTDLSLQAATASRLTPILYEKFKGNPRRIKRFMNDLHVRQSIASRRGIKLEPDAIAKLMVLEKLLENDFSEVLSWLAMGTLRAQFENLRLLAETGSLDQKKGVPMAKGVSGSSSKGGFTATMVRWAKLPPELDAAEVSGYLTLAAAFRGRLLLDEALPEQLRDIAAALTSDSQIERSAIKDEELKKLSRQDISELILHLGRRVQDEPSIQLSTVNALLTIADLHAEAISEVKSALRKLPSSEITPPTILLFSDKASAYSDVLSGWRNNVNDRVAKAIDSISKGSK